MGGHCGSGPCSFAFSRRRTPSLPAFVGRCGIFAKHGAECAPRVLRGSTLGLLRGRAVQVPNAFSNY
eukprot:12727302-Alexandrium_andersonii.AAC.1